MFMKHRQTVAAMAFLSLFAIACNQTVFASKGEPKVEAKNNDPDKSASLINTDNPNSVRFGTINANSPTLTVVAESAKVTIKKDSGISEIVLFSNCPRNWAVAGSLVRQAGFAGEPRKGSALLADALGSRAIVNGHVYLFPPGPMKGLKLGADGVSVNGQMVDPLKGSDIPCNCSGDDLLEIHVPVSFSGDLKIGSGGKSAISVESWKGGAVECTMTGNSSFTAGRLEALPKFVFDNKGNGPADIAEVDAKVFVANISGQGNASILVKKGKAEMSNATVEGNGTIELHGKFDKMQQAVNGNGKIEVKP